MSKILFLGVQGPGGFVKMAMRAFGPCHLSFDRNAVSVVNPAALKHRPQERSGGHRFCREPGVHHPFSDIKKNGGSTTFILVFEWESRNLGAAVSRPTVTSAVKPKQPIHHSPQPGSGMTWHCWGEDLRRIGWIDDFQFEFKK